MASFVYRLFFPAQQHSMNPSQSYAFGVAEWEKYFGNVGIGPPLPADIQTILTAPCPFWPDKKVQDTHLLVLIPQFVNGQPLTLKLLGELIKNPLQGKVTQYRDFYLGEHIDSVAPESHWVLLTQDVVVNSCNKSYSDQKVLIKAPYEIPTVLDAAVVILMEYVRTGTRLFTDSPWNSTRCQEKYDAKHQLSVGGFSRSGLVVSNWGDNGYFGVAALRKFH